VFVREGVYNTVMDATAEGVIEFFHGYTYSGHPLACAAAVATQKLYQDEGLLTRVAREGLDKYWEDGAHSLKGAPLVKDIRNLGLVCGIELEARPGAVGKRAFETFLKCYEKGTFVRFTGDTIAMSPPLIINKSQIDELFSTLREVLHTIP
jgi:beta-alanine--pyruvate transaminase